jgi:hypothetical protein
MTERRAVVRSYQRLFRPDRRIYSVDGRTIPIPGGVPLRWLGHAAAAAICGLILAGLHPIVIGSAAAGSYWWAARLGTARTAAALALGVAGLLVVVGVALGALDWPMRLGIVPAVAASALTQPSPDGRSIPRFLMSYLRVRVASRRRLGMPLHAAAGAARVCEQVVRVAADYRRPTLARGRITGPCLVKLEEPIAIRRRRGAIVARPIGRHRGGTIVDTLALREGERFEVRP